MSSIQAFPVEILLDVFGANDPADMESLQLTVRRFHAAIRQNVDTLPTRLVCDLVSEHNSEQEPDREQQHDRVQLYRAPANNGSGRDADGRETREPIASGGQTPEGLQEMYQMFGRKIAIRELDVWIGERSPDATLTLLLDHFPSVKAAVRLDMHVFDKPLPTDAVLGHFKRLETIWMDTRVDHRTDTSFWSGLLATKAFRRVPNFLGVNQEFDYPPVDAGELFDFITDFSLMPSDKPRVILFMTFDDGGPVLNALEQRFNENIASIAGQACALIGIHVSNRLPYKARCLTNMASGDQKETYALELFRKLTYYRE